MLADLVVSDVTTVSYRGPGGLGFGHGIHFCLGAALARMEAKIGLEALVTRFQAVARVPGEGALRYNRAIPVRGPEALRLQLLPAISLA